MHKIEVFVADCPLCRETLRSIRNVVAECGCEVVVHRCEGDVCCEPAIRYGIRAVPTIVINERIVHVGKISESEFRKILEDLSKA